jgi:hypothetical protein
MFRHLPKLLWTLAALLGLLFLANGFSFKPKTTVNIEQTNNEKSTGSKMHTGFDMRNLSHHLLDF